MNVELSICSSNDSSSSADGSSVLLVFPGTRHSPEQASSLVTELALKFKTIVLTSSLPAVSEVESYVKGLVAEIERSKIKRVTILGLHAGSTIAIALAIAVPKVVRRVILLNATTRLAPTIIERAIDRIEEFLPFGLPLRPLSSAYDSRPELHRIHCPTLVLSEESASSFHREQSELIATRIPNAWLVQLASAVTRTEKHWCLSQELVGLVSDFQQVAVKCPQKNGSLFAEKTAQAAN